MAVDESSKLVQITPFSNESHNKVITTQSKITDVEHFLVWVEQFQEGAGSSHWFEPSIAHHFEVEETICINPGSGHRIGLR